MRKGFTILEVVISMVLSAAILTAVVFLHAPLVTQFTQAFNFQRLRLKVASPLDALRRELGQAKAVVVDASQCYVLCLTDRVSGNRIYYYWSGSNLQRKSEVTTNAIACSGGKPFVLGLDNGSSTFTKQTDLLSISLKALGTSNSSYTMTSGMFPAFSERMTLFYDGFNCNSSTSGGWVLNNTLLIYWAIEQTTAAVGRYWLKQTLIQNQVTPITATAEIPLKLTRVNSVHLQFKYRTTGTMDPGELLVVSFYDGIWREVFRDNLDRSLGSLQSISVDLSPYAINDSNRLRFEGTLKNRADKWMIDEIEIFSK